MSDTPQSPEGGTSKFEQPEEEDEKLIPLEVCEGLLPLENEDLISFESALIPLDDVPENVRT